MNGQALPSLACRPLRESDFRFVRVPANDHVPILLRCRYVGPLNEKRFGKQLIDRD